MPTSATPLEPAAGIAAWLSDRAEREDVCLVEGDTALTWATVVQRSRALARGFSDLGVQPGDRVGLWLPNSSAWLVTFFACAQIGAIAVSVNTRFRSAEVADLLQRSGVKLLVCWPGFKAIDFAGILDQCGASALQAMQTVVAVADDGVPVPARIADKPAVAFSELLRRTPMTESPASGETPCIIFTTSGTTKAPKMVLHKHAHALHHGLNVARQYGLGPDKRFLLLPPFCGAYGFCSAMAALVSGASLVIEAVWNPDRFAELVDAHAITHFTASNEALAQLLDVRSGADPVFPSLELVVQANLNPAHADVCERAQRLGVVTVGLYGSSEVMALFSHCDPTAAVELRARAGGRPASGAARVRARDTETQALCAPGQAGELEFLAPESRFVEYFLNPEATAEAFTDDGWFKSGDLGVLDPDGGFTYLARMGDTLRLGGFLVSPAEIESVVQEDAAVESCQVVGARMGDAVRPVAFVRARGDATVDEAAIIRHVGGRLAKYKVPVRVVSVQAFPTTAGANGTKVQKNKLKEMAEAMLAASA